MNFRILFQDTKNSMTSQEKLMHQIIIFTLHNKLVKKNYFYFPEKKRIKYTIRSERKTEL